MNPEKLHRALARSLFPRNSSQMGGGPFKWKGKWYLITTGTGDGNYAYPATEVADWLDELDGEPGDYTEFCEKVSPETSKALAKEVAAEMDIDLYDGGVRIRYENTRLDRLVNRLVEAMNWASIADEAGTPAKKTKPAGHTGSYVHGPANVAAELDDPVYDAPKSGFIGAASHVANVFADLESDSGKPILTPNQAKIVAAVKGIVAPAEAIKPASVRINKTEGLELWDTVIQVRPHKSDPKLVVLKVEGTSAAAQKQMLRFLTWIKLPDMPVSVGAIKVMAFVNHKTLVDALKKVKTGDRELEKELVQRFKTQL